jgi:predicted ester cyclase
VRAFPDFHFEATVIHHADEAVIVEGRMTGTQEGEWSGIPPHQGRMDLPMVCVYNFDGDHLMNETVYFDFATLQRQLGAA